MKVNLNVIPNANRVWTDPYLSSDLAKAGLLAAGMVKHLNLADANQRNARIQELVGQTPIVKDILTGNTLDSELFCALVAAYVVKEAAKCNGDDLAAFPVPFSVIEDVIKDLFGEEETEQSV